MVSRNSFQDVLTSRNVSRLPVPNISCPFYYLYSKFSIIVVHRPNENDAHDNNANDIDENVYNKDHHYSHGKCIIV